jgi:hypothetical protein
MWKRYFVVTVVPYQLLTVARDDVAKCGAILRMKSCAPCNWECVMGEAAVAFATTVAARVAARARRLTRIVFNSYRPELHYMRGPGPKWREKHGQLPTSSDLRDLDLSRLNAGG